MKPPTGARREVGRNNDGMFDLGEGVFGVFHDVTNVNRAVRALSQRSVPADVIRVFLVDDDGRRLREVRVEDEAGAKRGALIGAGIGAGCGLIVAIVVPLGLLGSPVLSFFGITSVVGALRVIGICALIGVPLGTILGMSHWDFQAQIPPDTVAPGEVHVAVASEKLAPLAREILRESGAERVA